MSKTHQISDFTNTRMGRVPGITNFYSEWSADCKMISMKVDGTEVVKDGELDKKHWLYSKAKTGMGRHLKTLKKKLGILGVKEPKFKKVLIQKYNDWGFDYAEIETGAKMFEHQRVTSLYIYDATPENCKLAREYNELLKQIKTLQDKQDLLKKQMK